LQTFDGTRFGKETRMRWNGIRQTLLRHRAIVGTVILLIFAVTGTIQKGVARMGTHVSQENDKYLTESIKSTVHVMIPVGIAKAAADVVEGSEAVVEWGDITQPILDYLDVAWRILILSLIVSTATKYTLLGVAPLANAFLVLSLSFYLALAIIRSITAPDAAIRICIKRIAGLFLLTYLLLVAILPLTILGTGRLSHTITEPLRAETFSSFDRVGRVFSLDSITQQDGFLDKVDAVKKKAAEIIRFCGSATADIAGSVAKLAVVKLLEGVVFPLACLAFLIWLVRGTLYPALGLSDKSLAAADFRRIGDLLSGGGHQKKQTPDVEPATPPYSESAARPPQG
jgi:hypothetical protein